MMTVNKRYSTEYKAYFTQYLNWRRLDIIFSYLETLTIAAEPKCLITFVHCYYIKRITIFVQQLILYL